MRGLPALVLVALLVVAGCAVPGTIVATEVIDQRLEVEPRQLVLVETFNGRISVGTGGEGAIGIHIVKRGSGLSQAEADRDLGRVEVTVAQEDRRVTITARRTDSPAVFGDTGADVELTVPQDSSLELRTSNGRIEASNVLGSIVARSSNGGVTIRDGHDVDAETSNGPLLVAESSGVLKLRTSNGALDILNVQDVLLSGETSNGAITFSGSLDDGDHVLRTSNAMVGVSLPDEQAFTIDGRTTNGTIRTDFPLTVTLGLVNGTVGEDPEAHLRIETSNGDLSVTRQVP